MKAKTHSSVNSLAIQIATFILKRRLGCSDGSSIIHSPTTYGMQALIPKPNDMPLRELALELQHKLPDGASWTRWSSPGLDTRTEAAGLRQNVMILSSAGLESTPQYGDSLIVLRLRSGGRGKWSTAGVVSVYCMVFGPQLNASERNAYAKDLRTRFRPEPKD